MEVTITLKERKKRFDKEFGERLTENYKGDKKSYWKVVIYE